MNDFFLRLFFAVLFISGVWTAFRPGMIFGKFGDWIEYYAKLLFDEDDAEKLVKPLFRCPPCMSSCWGSGIWFAFGGSWLGWPPFVVCLCGALSIIFLVLSPD